MRIDQLIHWSRRKYGYDGFDDFDDSDDFDDRKNNQILTISGLIKKDIMDSTANDAVG